ncbi:MAG: UDP binding domain-containing protein [Clostridia bacterium]
MSALSRGKISDEPSGDMRKLSCGQLAALFYNQSLERAGPVAAPAVAEMTKVFENISGRQHCPGERDSALGRPHGTGCVGSPEGGRQQAVCHPEFSAGTRRGRPLHPLDPFYLARKAREYDFPTRFIKLAGDINLRKPYFILNKQDALKVMRKLLNGSRVLLLGVAYRRDSNYPRESPALKVMELLEQCGAEVIYHDPFIPVLKPQASYGLTAPFGGAGAKSAA